MVTVIEAANVEYDHTSVTVRAGGKEHTTPYSETSQPQFNSQFTFNGLALNDAIEVVLNSADNELYTLKGVQPVAELDDQKIHDKWLPVSTDPGQRSNTRVHLQYQYTYLKSKLCQEAIENWEQHIQNLTLKNEQNEKDLAQMYQGFDFLESIAKKPHYFSDIKPVDKIVNEEIYEPKFAVVPPKPLHPIFSVLLLTAILVGIVALMGLEYKYHMFIDLLVVAWILTLQFSELITFTFLNVIVAILFVLVAIGFEVAWFVLYKRVG